jgi:hypothetical protein
LRGYRQSRQEHRSAAVISQRYGYIIACDPKQEQQEKPHAYIFSWDDGQIDRGECNYDAHSLCLIEQPKKGLINISEAGYFSVETDDDGVLEDLFTHSMPPPATRRARGLRSVREIADHAHAIGISGMVYRLDKPDLWTRIDDGLPDSFDGEAIHGFGLSDLYAVGRGGQVWHYDGKEWRQEDVPTNQNLYAVTCAPDGTVYAGGLGGTLLCRRKGKWTEIEQKATAADIWDLEWFADRLFVSALHGLFTLEGKELQLVNYGEHTVNSTYQLSARKGVLWSNGEKEIMEFDGKTWTRIV